MPTYAIINNDQYTDYFMQVEATKNSPAEYILEDKDSLIDYPPASICKPNKQFQGNDTKSCHQESNDNQLQMLEK